MRRRTLLALGGSLALGGCSTHLSRGVVEPPALTPVDPGTGWPVPQHGPNGGSVAPAAAGPDPTRATEQWRYSVPSRMSPPVASRERLYVTVGDEVRALDPTTGDELWTWDGAPHRRPPSVAGETVYVATPGTSETATDALVALDAATGDLRWRRTTPELRGLLPFDDAVLVSQVDGLALLDAATGATRTRYAARGLLATLDGGVEHTPRLVADGTTVYVPLALGDGTSRESRVVALDLDGPSVRWRSRRFEYGLVNSLSVVDGTLVVGTDVALWAFDATDGTFQWRQLGFGYPLFRLTAGRGLVVAHRDQSLVAYDAADGTVQWRAPGDGFRASIVGETVYATVHTPEGQPAQLRAYDAATGEQRATFYTAPVPDTRPVVADGRLFTLVRPGGSRLTCYA